MVLEVKVFASVREAAGGDVVRVELEEGATIDSLRRTLAEMFPEVLVVIETSMFAIDGEYVTGDAVVKPHSEIACIPPVSGG